MAVSVEILKGFSILRDLPDAALTELAAQSVLKRYSRREVVIDPGEQESNLCFLFEGSLVFWRVQNHLNFLGYLCVFDL